MSRLIPVVTAVVLLIACKSPSNQPSEAALKSSQASRNPVLLSCKTNGGYLLTVTENRNQLVFNYALDQRAEYSMAFQATRMSVSNDTFYEYSIESAAVPAGGGGPRISNSQGIVVLHDWINQKNPSKFTLSARLNDQLKVVSAAGSFHTSESEAIINEHLSCQGQPDIFANEQTSSASGFSVLMECTTNDDLNLVVMEEKSSGRLTLNYELDQSEYSVSFEAKFLTQANDTYYEYVLNSSAMPAGGRGPLVNDGGGASVLHDKINQKSPGKLTISARLNPNLEVVSTGIIFKELNSGGSESFTAPSLLCKGVPKEFYGLKISGNR